MNHLTSPRRAVAALAVAAALIAPTLAGAPAPAAEIYGTKKVVGNLEQVAAFAVAPDGDIFLAERITGKIKLWDSTTETKSPFAAVSSVSGSSQNELGLVGIVLDPNYGSNGFVYVYVSRTVSGAVRLQILRFTNTGGTGTNQTLIHQNGSTAGGGHIGGKMAFGPDGKLWVVVGDRFDPSLAQNDLVERGKTLRMNPNGTIPGDNPTPGSRVYSYGHRNSFGLTFDPVTGDPWQTENGPECNDEINKLEPAGNFGWGPRGTCDTPPDYPRNTNGSGPKPRFKPEAFYRIAQGLTGIAFCDDCELDATAEGKTFWGAFNTGDLTMATLDAGRTTILSRTVVHTDRLRVLSIETGPDGAIYYANGKTIYRLRLL